MKNVSLIISCLLVSSLFAYAGSYKKICKNGGENGYYSSKITVDDNGNTLLTYEGKGYEKPVNSVGESTRPNIPKSVQEQVNLVVKQMVNQGKMTGKGTLPFEGRDYHYKWKFEDTDGYTSEVVITD